MPLTDLDELPLTIDMGDGSTMTFLRNQPYLTRLHVPGLGKELYVPPHWHEMHDELFRVVKGRLRVTINGVAKEYVSEDGEINIPKGTIHSIRSFQGEEVIFEERTVPMDEQKELFFRNLLADGMSGVSNPLQAMIVMHNGDTYMGLPGHVKWLEKGLGAIFGGYLAPLLGYQIKYHGVVTKNR